ncbi:TIGR04283 family arsenosugar biosynthesis glycosyltransferase [Candidatus Halobeggiatoa sp. HSG11]|nr:TIGR04283 family arsenosugar biosynthesis glycosyltransferase [Candidatus Halobeggiatoa sp. HSG11]
MWGSFDLKISVIIPTLNEQAVIVENLLVLQSLRKVGHELIVVDGGSDDDTYQMAIPLADKILRSERGRAKQMNLGAKSAQYDILLFLHADTFLPVNADGLIINGLANGYKWGRFNVRLSGVARLLRVVEKMMNWRSCLTGVATGDQAIFVRQDLYEQVKGFPDIPLMEDIAFSKNLKCFGSPICIKQPVITSSRRWEQNGIIRTIFLMWRLRLAYFLGISSYKLKDFYN